MSEPVSAKAIYDQKTRLHPYFDFREPRNHAKCWGRGYIGTRIIKGVLNYYLCDCVLKPVTPETSLARLTALAKKKD